MTTKEKRAVRGAVIERAGGKCERCALPDVEEAWVRAMAAEDGSSVAAILRGLVRQEAVRREYRLARRAQEVESG